MHLTAGKHYAVREYISGPRAGQIRALACLFCGLTVNVVALHRPGDKSGAPRYYRARNRMVKHVHADHRTALHRHTEP